MTPSDGAGTSSITLSVSRSTMFSSRLTISPAFLCHVDTVASDTDSGKSGTLTSIAISFSFISLMPESLIVSVLFHEQHDNQPQVLQQHIYPHIVKRDLYLAYDS